MTIQQTCGLKIIILIVHISWSKACYPGVVFTAMEMEDTFDESCEVIHFPCDTTGPEKQRSYVDPEDCTMYYLCTDRRVFHCLCAAGDSFDKDKRRCVDSFNANCGTCERNKTSPDEFDNDEEAEDTEGSQTSEVVAGVVVGVLALVAVAIILICCWIRRKRKSCEASDTEKTVLPNTYISSGSVYDNIRESQVYHNVTEKHPPDVTPRVY